MTQHSFTLSMYKNYLDTMFAHIAVHGLSEYIKLIVKYICRRHSCSCIKKLVSMQVNNNRFVF